MATVSTQKREVQLDLYPRPVEPFVPHFEQVEGRWTWRHFVALTGFSILLHIVFVLLIVAVIVALPRNSPIVLTARQLLAKDDSVQYLQLAPDQQKLVEHPKTNVISDKDRMTSSRAPSIDRKTLDRLADNLRRGAPSPAATNAVSPQAPQPQQQPAPQSGPPAQPSTQQQIAELHSPALPGRGRALPDFGGPASAGAVIQQAARAASEQRGGGGESGDYGSGPAFAKTAQRGDFEVLSDTLGVDFAPYLQRMRLQIMNNWMNLIPEAARAPLRKKGLVVIEFSVLKDGTVTGVRLVGPSGDISLDRAAFGAITASNPMPQLPTDFRGDYFTVRGRFFYNPDRNEMQ
ncbi:MAG: TonB C-terminal domain-containing protein [Acidobacteriota bacterium]|nr:TonB C-terminal domain-containing protein [Acidobacteriota bacterium]